MNPVYMHDSAPLEASIFAEDGVTPITPTSASWSITRPDGNPLLVTTLPTYIPVVGERIITDAVIGAVPRYHTLEWNGTAWIDLGTPYAVENLTDNTTSYLVPTFGTYMEGTYKARAMFILSDGSQRSQFIEFEVYDPLATSTTDFDKMLDLTWLLFEDCFDSDLGGPYLRDVTLANFDRKKVAALAPMALLSINVKPPVQNFTIDNFPYADSMALFAKSLEIEVFKHLMRSYVEQPAVQGSSSISYFDRRDYLQRWQTLYQIEADEFKHWLTLWKRGFYNFGSGSLLIDMKSGRRQMYPQIDRARGRYWY
jgi:hypothetical protein